MSCCLEWAKDIGTWISWRLHQTELFISVGSRFGRSTLFDPSNLGPLQGADFNIMWTWVPVPSVGGGINSHLTKLPPRSHFCIDAVAAVAVPDVVSGFLGGLRRWTYHFLLESLRPGVTDSSLGHQLLEQPLWLWQFFRLFFKII